MKRAVPWVTERNQCAIYCFVSSKVTHRMRVRLTVRYRTFGRTVCQVLFVVWSHIHHPPRASDHRGFIREKGRTRQDQSGFQRDFKSHLHLAGGEGRSVSPPPTKACS